MSRILGLLLFLTPLPGRAEVGLAGGLVRQSPDSLAAKRLDGWEGSVMALEPEGKGFWVFAGGQARGDETQVTWGQARLNFVVVGGKTGALFLGGGTGLGWLDTGGTRRRAWLTSAEAGLLVSPLRILEVVWPNCPCVSCLFGRGSPDCTTCLREKSSGKSLGAVRVGVEAGWRKAALGLAGPEYRAWVGLVF